MECLFFDERLQLLAGPYVDLPFIKATMTQLATSDVNENCETGSGQTNSDFSKAFQSLTQITGEIGIGIGFELEAVVDFPDGDDPYSFVRSGEGWNTTLSLPTVCLAFTEESGFAVVRDVLGDMTNSSNSESDSGKSAANSLNPFGTKFSLVLGLSWMVGFFAIF